MKLTVSMPALPVIPLGNLDPVEVVPSRSADYFIDGKHVTGFLAQLIDIGFQVMQEQYLTQIEAAMKADGIEIRKHG